MRMLLWVESHSRTTQNCFVLWRSEQKSCEICWDWWTGESSVYKCVSQCFRALLCRVSVLCVVGSSGGEEEPDHDADGRAPVVRDPRRSHQPLHGHVQEDERRLLRPLYLLLHLHHVSWAATDLRLRRVLRIQRSFFFCYPSGHESVQLPHLSRHTVPHFNVLLQSYFM